MKTYIVFYCLLFISKASVAQCSNCGVYILKHRLFDSSINAFKPFSHDRDIRMMYKDSVIIAPSISIYTDIYNDIETDWYAKDLYFTFIDLHTKKFAQPAIFTQDSIFMNRYSGLTFYQYPAFSKDSFFSRKYNNLDTALRWSGWPAIEYDSSKAFSKRYASNSVLDSIVNMADTIIDNMRCIRRKYCRTIYKPAEVLKSISIGYYSFNVQPWMLIFDREIDKKTGAIWIRHDWLIVGKQTWLSDQFEFIPGLTQEELEVFAAWEKNAKENPIE
jgi:hypothetical protein